jgi:hypothetical protein
MALRTDNLRFGRLKKQICYVNEAMFLGVGLPCELILFAGHREKRL